MIKMSKQKLSKNLHTKKVLFIVNSVAMYVTKNSPSNQAFVWWSAQQMYMINMNLLQNFFFCPHTKFLIAGISIQRTGIHPWKTTKQL